MGVPDDSRAHATSSCMTSSSVATKKTTIIYSTFQTARASKENKMQRIFVIRIWYARKNIHHAFSDQIGTSATRLASLFPAKSDASLVTDIPIWTENTWRILLFRYLKTCQINPFWTGSRWLACFTTFDVTVVTSKQLTWLPVAQENNINCKNTENIVFYE